MSGAPTPLWRKMCLVSGKLGIKVTVSCEGQSKSNELTSLLNVYTMQLKTFVAFSSLLAFVGSASAVPTSEARALQVSLHDVRQ